MSEVKYFMLPIRLPTKIRRYYSNDQFRKDFEKMRIEYPYCCFGEFCPSFKRGVEMSRYLTLENPTHTVSQIKLDSIANNQRIMGKVTPIQSDANCLYTYFADQQYMRYCIVPRLLVKDLNTDHVKVLRIVGMDIEFMEPEDSYYYD